MVPYQPTPSSSRTEDSSVTNQGFLFSFPIIFSVSFNFLGARDAMLRGRSSNQVDNMFLHYSNLHYFLSLLIPLLAFQGRCVIAWAPSRSQGGHRLGNPMPKKVFRQLVQWSRREPGFHGLPFNAPSTKLSVHLDREADLLEQLVGGERYEMNELPDSMMDTTIFVGNLNEFVQDQDLSDLFQAVSSLQTLPACVVRKPDMSSLEYGFVSFPCKEEKEVSALSGRSSVCNTTEVHGKAALESWLKVLFSDTICCNCKR